MTQRTLLLIADISGYTEYMLTHRMSLAHAEVNTSRLLQRVVDAAPDFDLIEIEGDAAFLALSADRLPGDRAATATLEVAAAMHQAFHAERRYVGSNLCPCKGCTQVDNLRLKFVAHLGEVATQTIRQQRKLVGIDVILVHRLLKNSVDLPEYVLLTEDLQRQLPTGPAGREYVEDLEGIGPTRAYAVEVTALPEPALPEPGKPTPATGPSLAARLGRTLVVAGAGLPLMLRRRPAATV